jgi:phage repressor protein C with HTH and peptisase S24 domain
MQVWIARVLESFQKLAYLKGDKVSYVHSKNLYQKQVTHQDNFLSKKNIPMSGRITGMDVWPQRQKFKAVLDIYMIKSGKTQKEIAEALEMPLITLRNIIYQKDRKPSTKVMQKFSALFGVSVTKFLDDPNAGLQDNDSDEIIIPWFRLRPAAGDGSIADESDYYDFRGIVFSRRYLRQLLSADPANLYAFNIRGDSMEPEFHSGDLVLIDKGAIDMGFHDGIWMFRRGDGIAIKQVQMTDSRQLRAVSINTNYPPFMLDMSEDELIGRIVYQGVKR